jgi:hypothetical protein
MSYLNIVDRIDDTKQFALKRLESSGNTIAKMVEDACLTLAPGAYDLNDRRFATPYEVSDDEGTC